MSHQRSVEIEEAPPDAELMAAIGNGSYAELGVLFKRYADQVHALCYRLTGDADAADDLTQETFLRLRAGADAFRGASRLSTWLYRLAYNATVDHLRHVRAGHRAVDRLRRDLSHVRPSESPSEQSSRAAIVEAALAALPDDDRNVLVLTRYHDLRYEDVAAIIGCSAATARVRAHRAIQHLRQLCLEMERRDYDL